MQRAPCPARCAPSPRERRQARGYSRVKPSLSRLLKHENPIPKATKFDVHQIFPPQRRLFSLVLRSNRFHSNDAGVARHIDLGFVVMWFVTYRVPRLRGQ